MFPTFFTLLYILTSTNFSLVRGMRVGAPLPQNVPAGPPPNPGLNEQALQAIMGPNDPCHAAPPNANPSPNTLCKRAAAAFNSRDEALRYRCRFSVKPKCRLHGTLGSESQCTVKKLRPRSHMLCIMVNSHYDIVPLSWCAAPLFQPQMAADNQNANG